MKKKISTTGLSGVNQEELASDQKTVWRGVISRRIAAGFPDRSPAQIRVLDVGTGPGFFAIILAELGYQVKAVDYTASMLEEAKHNAGALAKKIDFRQMNTEEVQRQDLSGVDVRCQLYFCPAVSVSGCDLQLSSRTGRDDRVSDTVQNFQELDSFQNGIIPWVEHPL